MLVTFWTIDEESPGDKWKALFDRTWPHYRKWFLSEGLTAHKGYLTSSIKLRENMPEIFSIYETLAQLAGGGDQQSRFLSMYCPPPYMSGCSQVAWTKGEVALIRNYDYSPRLFEGVMLHTNWRKRVIGVSDCLWGLLDGMNEDGLAVSLTFGGQKIVGEGFGIPLVLRYVLETCATVDQATAVFSRIPVHMAYNVTLVDVSGRYVTIYLAPETPAQIVGSAVGTNHQMSIEWPDYAHMTQTVERKEYLEEQLKMPNTTLQGLVSCFLEKPLYFDKHEKAFGTLYTISYNLSQKTVQVHWPEKAIVHSFNDFTENKTFINFKENAMSML